ncbi:uncharacterized protein LOC124162164 isoform X3 [Ischnura elegans]|uniref:uncharacterized protein LOC124162164 isoform X3 n=1 Tax=Ischnura elegans TaxID=197161 RepID=UPI001ED871F9|nr:uncharacterized protein LOC124162164 isoform X3 [Ischnura elegans]XP_046394567.1 uncharacterized protein LOC124162164 isoform X3 [Ischnura elegans]
MYAAGQAIAIRQARKHVKKQGSGGGAGEPAARGLPPTGTHAAVRAAPGSGERFPRYPKQLHHHPAQHHGGEHHPHGLRPPHANGKMSWQNVPAEIRDASSGEYSYYGGFRAGGAASALLYVGLGTVAVGLVISFVGLGEKGFKTLELRMIGPGLIVGGLLLCLLRIFLCTCCPPPLPPPPCCLRKHFRLWRQRASARGQRNSAKAENEDEEAATSRCGFEEARLLKGTRKKVSPEVPPTTTTSSSQALSGSAPGLKRKPVVRHGPLPVTPVALHTDRRAAEATSSTPVVPPPPSGRTQLPNQVPGGDSDEERRVGEVGRTGASRKKAVGSTVSRGRTNKVWSEVSGGPPEGRWVAPDDERSGRIRDSRVEAGREGDWAGRGLANPDPEAHQVEGGEQQRTQRTSAGASRRVRTQRQSSSRTDKELVLSPASLEGL